MATPSTPAFDPEARARRVRRTALLLGMAAAVFYVGSLLILVWRANR